MATAITSGATYPIDHRSRRDLIVLLLGQFQANLLPLLPCSRDIILHTGLEVRLKVRALPQHSSRRLADGDSCIQRLRSRDRSSITLSLWVIRLDLREAFPAGFHSLDSYTGRSHSLGHGPLPCWNDNHELPSLHCWRLQSTAAAAAQRRFKRRPGITQMPWREGIAWGCDGRRLGRRVLVLTLEILGILLVFSGLDSGWLLISMQQILRSRFD